MISKSALGAQMSGEEQRRLKEDLSSLGMDDISSFMEALPRDFYVILRTEYGTLLSEHIGILLLPSFLQLINVLSQFQWIIEVHFGESRGATPCSASHLCKMCYTWARETAQIGVWYFKSTTLTFTTVVINLS
jgi:hypothetical protein